MGWILAMLDVALAGLEAAIRLPSVSRRLVVDKLVSLGTTDTTGGADYVTCRPRLLCQLHRR